MTQRVHGSAFVIAARFQGGVESILHTALGEGLSGLRQGRCGYGLQRERAASDGDASSSTDVAAASVRWGKGT